jgi:hypothetical protein
MILDTLEENLDAITNDPSSRQVAQLDHGHAGRTSRISSIWLLCLNNHIIQSRQLYSNWLILFPGRPKTTSRSVVLIVYRLTRLSNGYLSTSQWSSTSYTTLRMI